MGLGETSMKEYVGMFHGGECALALRISIIEAAIENVKSKAIVIAAVLFLVIFMYFSSPFILCLQHYLEEGLSICKERLF
jgi:hypothetical protein